MGLHCFNLVTLLNSVYLLVYVECLHIKTYHIDVLSRRVMNFSCEKKQFNVHFTKSQMLKHRNYYNRSLSKGKTNQYR